MENCSGDFVVKLLPSSVKQIAAKLIRSLLSFRGQCKLVNEPSFLTEVLSVGQKTGKCKYETEILHKYNINFVISTHISNSMYNCDVLH